MTGAEPVVLNLAGKLIDEFLIQAWLQASSFVEFEHNHVYANSFCCPLEHLLCRVFFASQLELFQTLPPPGASRGRKPKCSPELRNSFHSCGNESRNDFRMPCRGIGALRSVTTEFGTTLEFASGKACCSTCAAMRLRIQRW